MLKQGQLIDVFIDESRNRISIDLDRQSKWVRVGTQFVLDQMCLRMIESVWSIALRLSPMTLFCRLLSYLLH